MLIVDSLHCLHYRRDSVCEINHLVRQDFVFFFFFLATCIFPELFPIASEIQNLQHLLAPSTLVAPALPSHGRRLDAIESRPSSRERTGDGWSPTSEQLNRVIASGARNWRKENKIITS